MQLFDIFSLGFNIFIWSFFPFINKHLLTNISPIVFTIIGRIIGAIISFVFLYSNQSALQQSPFFYIIIFIMSLVSFFSNNIYNSLLKKYDANFLAVIINPLIIFLSALFGTLFFNEKFNSQMWLGTFIIIIGLIIFINGKKK